MKRSLKPLTVLSLLASLTAGCAIPSVDVAPRYGYMDVDGSYSLLNTNNAGSSFGTSADLNTAGIDKDDSYLGARIDLDLGMPVLTLTTQTTNHGGDGTLNAVLDPFVINEAVTTNLDLGIHSLAMTWDIIPTDYVDIGIGLGVTVIDLDASITDSGGTSITADETIPIPVLAIRARVELGDFRFAALMSGIDLDLGTDEASFYDFDLMAEYHLLGGDSRLSGSIGLGYRHTTLDFAYEDGGDDIDVEMDLDGPYIAFVLTF